MTTVHFVRHGETVWHLEGRYAGSSDIALTETGVLQAGAVARWASTTAIDHVVSSDLQRAVRTAEPAARAAGLELEVDPRWRELDFGGGEGLSHEELAERHPVEFGEFERHPSTVPLLGGEPGVSGVARASAALEQLVERFAGGTVLVVAHSTLGRLLLCSLLEIPLDNYRRVFPFMLNGAVTTLEIDRLPLVGNTHLLGFNVPLA